MGNPASPIDLLESVAGEEDPGASADLAMQTAGSKDADPARASRPGASDQPAGGGVNQPGGPQAPMAPGDEAPPGTPSTGENVCPQCGGSGKAAGGTCPNCQGTGKVIVGIGGA